MNKIRERFKEGYIGVDESVLHEQMYDDINSLLILFDALDRSRKPNSVAFSLFCAENYYYQGENWWDRNYIDEALTTEDVYSKFIESYGK